MKQKNSLKVPGVGRLGVFREKAGQGTAIVGQQNFDSHLSAVVFRNGKPLKAKDTMSFSGRFWSNIRGSDTTLDLGSGLTTNVFAMSLANEPGLASPSGAAINALTLGLYVITGTNTTAAAATDIQLGTYDSNGVTTGVQTLLTAANSQKVQNVATCAYTGTEAVTEWGLLTANSVSATTGTPLTAVSATSATVTGTPYTASSTTVQGQQQHIIATGTTTVWGFIKSNTSSVLSLANDGTHGWWKVADGTAGSTPGATEAFTLYPILIDHKVFSAINVVNGDSIQFTYQLTVNSGG